MTYSSPLLDSAMRALTDGDLRLAARFGYRATFEVILEKVRFPSVKDGRAELGNSNYVDTPGVPDGSYLAPEELRNLIWQLLGGKGDFVEVNTLDVDEHSVYKILRELGRRDAEFLANRLAEEDSSQTHSISQSDLARAEDYSRQETTHQIISELTNDYRADDRSPFFTAGLFAVVLKLVQQSGDSSLLSLFQENIMLAFEPVTQFGHTEYDANRMAGKLTKVSAFVQKVQALPLPW